LHCGHRHERISTRVKRQTRSVEPSLTALAGNWDRALFRGDHAPD
jgi:hypothetical protein